MNDDINDGSGTYEVVVLVENAISRSDAQKIRSLHEGIGDPVVYHVIVPISRDAERLRSSLASVASESPWVAVPVTDEDIAETERVSHEVHDVAEKRLALSLKHLRAAHAGAEGETVSGDDVIKSLEATVKKFDTREVIVLTEPHAVAEFFKLDWASKAERHLKVPVLHLLEHESLTAQAAQNEGFTWL